MLPVYHTQYASCAVLQVGDFEHEAVPAGHHFAAPEVRFSQLLSFTYRTYALWQSLQRQITLSISLVRPTWQVGCELAAVYMLFGECWMLC
jgi:hypothetical protein